LPHLKSERKILGKMFSKSCLNVKRSILWKWSPEKKYGRNFLQICIYIYG